MNVFVIIFLVGLSTGVNSARILGIFQMPSYSHQCVFQPIWNELSLRGHQVTVVTPYPLKDPSLVNLTEIDVGVSTKEIFQRHGFQYFMSKKNYVHTKIQKIFALNFELCEAIFSNEQFKAIYNDSETKFDLVLAQTYVSPILYALSAKLNAPLVGVSSMGGYIGTHFAMGNPHPPSLYSEMFLPYNGHMSLHERVKSSLYYWWVRYYLHFEALPRGDEVARRYLGHSLPPLAEIERNMSLLFLTTNPFLYTPRPSVPTVISLEQMHIQPVKPLPEDLRTFLDEATEGVIYFSLGSNVKSINMPEKLRNTMIAAFAELPYKVLWKFESDEMPNKPNNVLIRKWLPQQDVLAHPNVKVFVSQCGLQSTEEAVSRGVPMLGMPFIADQTMNIKRLAELGVALGVDYESVTKEELVKAIKEVAENPKYKRNMENLRSQWVDQPMSALDRAMWWIEYVIRHKGTKHLRSPTVDAAWLEYFLLDVLLVVVLGVAVLVFLTISIVQFVVKLCRIKDKGKVD